MGAGNEKARRARRSAHGADSGHATQGEFEDTSAMDFEDPHQEDDNQDDDRRRNTSSEDEGDEDDGNQDRLVAIDMTPAVSNLVKHASQMIGSYEQDGTAMALAATSAASPTDALNLLAASSAMANVRLQRAGAHAAQAVVDSGIARRGLIESDSTYKNRFDHYYKELRLQNEETQRLTDRVAQLEVQRLTDRVAVLERLLGRVISMLRNGNIDATEARVPSNVGQGHHSDRRCFG
ncbi:hypothetical protein F5883DRAFT_717679 [Diaporthe sp. PMI_573]|nr:hypothetical protein F5883DRAFT_717679 [Diaporthaceae sp. PMI_573]